MSDIFISYASEDRNRVKSLAHALEKKGWSVWWDRRIPAGKSFDEVIHEALKAARSVVVVWTKTSVKSTWVKNESRSGLRRNILFPVMLVEEVEIPLEFEHLQAAHLMDWQQDQDHPGFDQFLDDLTEIIGVSVMAAVQPSPVPQSLETPSAPSSLPETMAHVELGAEKVDRELPAPETSSDLRNDEIHPSSLMQPQDSTQASHAYANEPTHAAPSAESLPYLPIGIGLFAAIGAVVYFLFFSQGPSPGTRDELRHQPRVQSSSPRIGRDGAPMVLVPVGEFIMGSREGDKDADTDERPAHSVYLDAFSIDQYEVTTSHFATFLENSKRSAPQGWSKQVPLEHGEKPVVGVDWNDATAYCAWAGKRLPTEAEWEKAARGTDQRRFPWGDKTPNERRANFWHCCDFKDYEALDDVGSFDAGKSPYGVYDMAGNAWEWVADWYDENYYGNSPTRNPKGPSSGEYRVIRGGSWYLDSPVALRSANRSWNTPTNRYATIGFRCTQDVPK